MSNLPGIVMALCVLSMPALADEYWICKYSGSGPYGSPLVKYVLRDKTLVQVSDVPWSYNVLIDNDLAIVATSGEGIKESHDAQFPNPIIQSETVALNRKTGEVVEGAITLYGSNVPVHGMCQMEPLPKPEDAPSTLTGVPH